MKATLVLWFSLVALALGAGSSSAQDIAAVTGTVLDQSGAVIPGVTVTLTNAATGLTFTGKTGSDGSYRILNVPPGPGYGETFQLQGFSPYAISNLYLNVGTTRTQDAILQAGRTEEVTVSASSENVTINTTDASVGNNFEVKLLNELPVYDRSTPAALFVLQPGVTVDGATTGARTDQNNVTLDGLDVNDFATGSAFTIVGNAPIDSVQEFRGTTAGFPVDSGPGGGGQFQLVTKGGTNRFHGNLNEYHRDTSTVANLWFNKNVSPQVARPAQIRNQFGGSLGGPIHKDRAFFFFDYDNSRIIQNSSPSRIVPLDSLRAGNLYYIHKGNDASGNLCGGGSRRNTVPECFSQLTPAQVAAIDPQHIGEDAALLASIDSRYPHANDLTGGDGINTGGFRFNTPRPNFNTNYVARIDFNLTSRQKIFGRGSVVRENASQESNQFSGDPATSPFVDRSYAYVVAHTWEISANKVNHVLFGETVADFAFPVAYNPQGLNPLTFGDGTTTLLSDPYTTPVNGQSRRVPIPEIADNFDWQLGRHSLQLGGTFKFIKSFSDTKLDYNTVTVGLGGNTLGLNASLRPADIRSLGTTASNTYDSAFAFLLGRIGSIASGYNYDNKGKVLPQGTGDARNYRYYQTQLYVGDTWKVSQSLTLSYGLNWQIFSVPYETSGLESTQNLTFDEYFKARVAQSAAGITGNNAVPLISYVLGGKANHGPGLYQPSYKDLAPRVAFAFNPTFDRKTVFNGSAGLVYDRTVINAVQYQQDQHSYLFQQQNSATYGIQGMPVQSLLTDPRLGANNAIPALVAPPTVSTPFQPFVAGGVPFGLQNGQAFNSIIDPSLKTPYSISYTFGMQHEFPAGTIFKLNYVGRLGRRLLAQADANQLVDFRDPVSGQLLSEAFGNITRQLRAGADPTSLPAQPFFENVVTPGLGTGAGAVNNTSFLATNVGGLVTNGDFADFVQAISGAVPLNVGMAAQFSENTFYTNKGFSAYNALLLTVQKNLTSGLQFDFNYTWAHSIDNVSLIANRSASAGSGFICDVNRPRECRGTSDFDQKHVITGDFTYNLPVGRGRQFAANIPGSLNQLIGGWDVSGIVSFHTGDAFGTVSNAFVAGYSNDAPATFVGANRSVISTGVHRGAGGSLNIFSDGEAAKGSYAGPVGFSIGSRNDLRGPRFTNTDLGLAKNFPIVGDRVNLKFRADAFNALNHPNFNDPTFDASGNPNTFPGVDITGGSFGQISSQTTVNGISSRVLQLALRLEF